MAKPSKKQLVNDGKLLVKDVSKHVKKAKISDDVRRRFDEELNALRQALASKDYERIQASTEAIDTLVDQHLDIEEKSAFREYAESIGLAVLFALLLRGFVVEAFKIPTGSMIPTLLDGDHIFVNKFIYGIRVPFTETYVVEFGQADRGEVIVFTFPRHEAKAHVAKQPVAMRDCIDRGSLEEEKDFIKRVVGVAGDTIEIRKGRLHVNGKMLNRTLISKERTGVYVNPYRIRERERNAGKDYTIQYTQADSDFGPVKVQDGHLFVMGDHRNHSSDSRCWGQVPVENVKGRAIFIWFSISSQGEIRWDRFGRIIN